MAKAKTNPIRLGLVGLGRAGWGMHCAELKGKERLFQFVAACDPAAERRDLMARTYPGCKTYERLEDLLADPAVEMIDIATRSCDHFPQALQAMKTDKDIFLEKPICETYEEARKILAASKKAKGTLYIRHNRRCETAFLHIREIMAAGLLGDVAVVKLARHSFNRRDDWQTLAKFGGGQLLNWGPHIVDHSLRMLDAPVESLWSDTKRVVAAGDAEDTLKLVFRGTNGRIVDMEISTAAAIPSPEYHILGSRGSLTCTGDDIKVKYIDPKAKLTARKANAGDPGTTFGSPEKLKWVEKSFKAKPKNAWNIWDELYSAVRQGTRFPITVEEAVEVMRVVSTVKAGKRFVQFAK